MKRDQYLVFVMDEIFSFEEARVFFGKFRKNHCNYFDVATIMTMNRYDAIIIEEVFSSKPQTDVQNLHTGQNVNRHESGIERSMTPQKAAFSKAEDSIAVFAAFLYTTASRCNELLE